MQKEITVRNKDRPLSLRFIIVLAAVARLEESFKGVTVPDVHAILKTNPCGFTYTSVGNALTNLKKFGLLSGDFRRKLGIKQGSYILYSVTSEGTAKLLESCKLAAIIMLLCATESERPPS